jgi:hypothetical protein
VAIDAALRLREQGFPVSLTLVGGVFPGYEWFEKKLRCTAADSPAISFAGIHDSVWALAEADIALVPSRWEPFGMSRSKRCSPVARLQAMSKGQERSSAMMRRDYSFQPAIPGRLQPPYPLFLSTGPGR